MIYENYDIWDTIFVSGHWMETVGAGHTRVSQVAAAAWSSWTRRGTECWQTTPPSPPESSTCRWGRWWSWWSPGVPGGGMSDWRSIHTLRAGLRPHTWRRLSPENSLSSDTRRETETEPWTDFNVVSTLFILSLWSVMLQPFIQHPWFISSFESCSILLLIIVEFIKKRKIWRCLFFHVGLIA